MNIALVYHPGMAPRRLARVAALARVLGERGHHTTHHDSMTFDAARDAPAAEALCICGGDGTAQLVISRQPDIAALPPVAIYPTGTINLLARELDYPRDPLQFTRRLEAGRAALAVPIAAINGRSFLCCISIGADAHAVAGLSEPLKARIGRLAYLVAMLRALLRWRRHPVELHCDEGRYTAEAVFIMRGRYYAGPWTLDPAAGLAGEQLRILALPRARRRDVARVALHALLGGKRPARDWHVITTRRIAISAGQALTLQIDGDHAPHEAVMLDIAMTGQTVHFC